MSFATKKNPLSSVPVRREQSASPVVSLQNEINQLFNEFFGPGVSSLFADAQDYNPAQQNAQGQQQGTTAPAVDVMENDKEFIIKVEIPGVAAQDLDISANGQYLRIKAERK